MTILALDTATEILSVALKVDERQVEATLDVGLRHSELLMPTLDRLVELAGAERRFDLVVCMKGPGSFTGLRIGMATAKGLSAGSSCPLVAVPTLEAEASGLEGFDGIVVPVIDARAGRLYAALFEAGRRLSEDLDVAPRELLERLAGRARALLTGPGARLALRGMEETLKVGEDEALRRELSSRVLVHPGYRDGRSPALLRLGLARLGASGPEEDDAGPLYLRPSEAELPARPDRP